MLLKCPYGCSVLDEHLKCKKGHSFEKRNGIFYLHRNDESWKACDMEAKGTIECLKEDGNYNKEDWKGQDMYPYFEKREHSTDCNRAMFDVCKSLIGKKRGSFLEIGSKSCWAVNQFLKMGFTEGVASDITDDDQTALGFGKELIDNTGRFFERVVCDAAYLPFEDSQFDMVFSVSTLHHIREKQKSFDEAYRVLKKGGIYISMGDNPRHIDRSLEEALNPVKREREKFHINETQPTVAEYYEFFDKAGFSDYFFYPIDSNILLEKDWDWSTDSMVARILLRGLKKTPHYKFYEQFNLLGSRTKTLTNTLERIVMLNYWMYVPYNVVMWGVK